MSWQKRWEELDMSALGVLIRNEDDAKLVKVALLKVQAFIQSELDQREAEVRKIALHAFTQSLMGEARGEVDIFYSELDKGLAHLSNNGGTDDTQD